MLHVYPSALLIQKKKRKYIVLVYLSIDIKVKPSASGCLSKQACIKMIFGHPVASFIVSADKQSRIILSVIESTPEGKLNY